MVKTKLFAPFAVALSLLAVPALAQNTEAPQNPPAAKPAKPKKPKAPKTPRVKGTAFLRVLHALPGGPAVDVLMDDKKVLDGVAYKTLSAYQPVTNGMHEFKVTATGDTKPLIELRRGLTKDKYFTVVVFGTPTAPQILAQNDVTGKPIPGKARLRVFHLVTGGPVVDVTTPSTRTEIGYASVFKNLLPGKTRMKAMTPGTVTLQLRADGKVLKEVKGVTLAADKRYQAFAVGQANGTGENALDIILVEAGDQKAGASLKNADPVEDEDESEKE